MYDDIHDNFVRIECIILQDAMRDGISYLRILIFIKDRTYGGGKIVSRKHKNSLTVYLLGKSQKIFLIKSSRIEKGKLVE